MYQTFRKSWNVGKYFILSGFIIIFLLLFTVVYKSDEKVTKKSESSKDLYKTSDLQTFKKFVLDQIKSPFIDIDYEIKN